MTSIAFRFIIFSSSRINEGLNIAFINCSPDWLPGTIIKFSKTDKFVNSCAIWKVLSKPLENNSYAGISVIFSLLNITLPDEHFKFPAIKLNKVVFPEPLGPIIPVIVPFLTFKEQPDTAANPPKYFERLFISKIFSDINYLFNLLWILLSVFITDL